MVRGTGTHTMDNPYALHLKSMLFRHGIVNPDGRPLYKYRFTSAEYARAVSRITSDGARALHSKPGRALFVMVLAEWFRRERDGGVWAWDPPLNALKLNQTQYGGGDRTLRYSDLIDAVHDGLKWWKRPGSKDLEGFKNIWAVVRESGLPLCEVRRDSWLRLWITAAVRRRYGGTPLEIAVEEERRRRAKSDQLSKVIADVVRDLVEKVFEYKRLVAAGRGGAHEDPVLRLSRIRPGWMDELPVPAEAEDMRALVAEVLRASTSHGEVFGAERVLQKRAGVWQPALDISLEGELNLAEASVELREALQGASRAQLFLRTSSGRSSSRAIGLIERTITGNSESLTVRALSRSQFEIALEEDVTLVCQVAERKPVLIPPRGASPQTEPVLAFAGATDDEDLLRLVSNGSADHSGNVLHLLINRSVLEEIDWSQCSERSEPQPVGENHVLVWFSGEARWQGEGLVYVWRTGCDTETGSPLLLDGPMRTDCRPLCYIGFPRVLFQDRGALIELGRNDLMWRPRGRGRWRRLAGEEPLGDVEIGLVRDGVLFGSVRETVLPSGFEFKYSVNGLQRQLMLSGLLDARIEAQKDSLHIEQFSDEAVISLKNLAVGSVFTLKLVWAERSVSLRFRDASLSQVVLKDDRPTEPGEVAGLGSLFRYAAWSQRDDIILFDLAGGGRGAGFVRKVSGDTPLTVYRDDIRALLSLSTDHDAKVDLSWRGGSRVLRISRYDLALPSGLWALATDEARVFLVGIGAASLIFIPILAPEKAAEVLIDDTLVELSYVALAERLTGAGPWIVTGRTISRERIRPVYLSTSAPSKASNALQAALLQPSQRTESLIANAKQSPEGRRQFAIHALKTARTARRYQMPLASFDSLTALACAPELAVTMLAAANGPEDIDTVLDLESELALVWPATAMRDWEEAFVSQYFAMHDELQAVGFPDPAIAAETLVKHLEQIALRSDLCLHACRAAHAVMHRAGMGPVARRLAEKPFEDALRETGAHSFLDLAQSMLRRRIDGVAAPRLELDSRVLGDLRNRFSESFNCVLAAPRIAARMATEHYPYNQELAAKLRQARLFDPEFFDAASSREALSLIHRTPA